MYMYTCTATCITIMHVFLHMCVPSANLPMYNCVSSVCSGRLFNSLTAHYFNGEPLPWIATGRGHGSSIMVMITVNVIVCWYAQKISTWIMCWWCTLETKSMKLSMLFNYTHYLLNSIDYYITPKGNIHITIITLSVNSLPMDTIWVWVATVVNVIQLTNPW